MAVGPDPGLGYPALVMRNVLTGAAMAEAITFLYAVGFFLFFGLGPTPRDYSSSWHFAARTAVMTLVLGTVIATPIGALLGSVAGRLVHRRPLKLVALAVGGSALVPLVGRTVVPSGEHSGGKSSTFCCARSASARTPRLLVTIWWHATMMSLHSRQRHGGKSRPDHSKG